jgi:hypothetical protein
MPRHFSKLAVGGIAALFLGCASGGQAAKGTEPAPGAAVRAAQAAAASPSRHDPDVLTQEEILATPGVTTALAAVTRLRPRFLRAEARTSLNSVPSGPIVRLDGQELGEVSTLSQVEIGLVYEIRYYSIVEAETKFGGVRGRPVIAVSTKRR